jgi:hypothetical protein
MYNVTGDYRRALRRRASGRESNTRQSRFVPVSVGMYSCAFDHLTPRIVTCGGGGGRGGGGGGTSNIQTSTSGFHKSHISAGLPQLCRACVCVCARAQCSRAVRYRSESVPQRTNETFQYSWQPFRVFPRPWRCRPTIKRLIRGLPTPDLVCNCCSSRSWRSQTPVYGVCACGRSDQM